MDVANDFATGERGAKDIVGSTCGVGGYSCIDSVLATLVLFCSYCGRRLVGRVRVRVIENERVVETSGCAIGEVIVDVT